MLKGPHLSLRPIQDKDWPTVEEWGQSREALWGPFQRFQLDHVPLLQQAYRQTGLLKRESGMLLIETLEDGQVIGYVRYTLIPYPDSDLPQPEIGFGIALASARGKGYAKEAVQLLVDYLFSGYPAERIGAFTESENTPARKVMESLGFQREGTLRRALFRDGQWRDICIYGLLRGEWKPQAT
ncbi:MAG TPA: GNAT family protein [Anaerolineales bacterium]|nr:GNAT family protein [Anaerolineales bacterium]